MEQYRLEMRDVTKTFPGVKALDGARLNLRPGTVHALRGENGAGKSTLMKCMFGIYKMDSGEIYFEGKKLSISDPLDALKHGIAMVHQELQPIPERNVAENIFLGRYPLRHLLGIPFIDHKKMYEQTEKLLSEVQIDLNPKEKLGNLSVSQMQTVEIAKAISADCKVLILDEPTSSLTEHEVEALFRMIETLKKKGVSIVYISHKMEEILRISDDVTIMRDGQYIGTWRAKELTIDQIIAKMVGRNLENLYPPHRNKPGEVVLQVSELSSIHPRSFQNVSFTLRRGEILGVGGLVGAQRTELVEALFGIRAKRKGKIVYQNKELEIKRPEDAIAQKFALVTEDRRGTGIFGVLSIEDNISIASLHRYRKILGLLDRKKIHELAIENMKKLSIKAPGVKTQIQTLSGGNQQKVIISRWLANDPDVLILDEPTRGIDVGAKYEIYSIIAELAEQGKSIIMISSEMGELLGMSDRIMVMCAGRVTGILDRGEATQESIMSLATQFSQEG